MDTRSFRLAQAIIYLFHKLELPLSRNAIKYRELSMEAWTTNGSSFFIHDPKELWKIGTLNKTIDLTFWRSLQNAIGLKNKPSAGTILRFEEFAFLLHAHQQKHGLSRVSEVQAARYENFLTKYRAYVFGSHAGSGESEILSPWEWVRQQRRTEAAQGRHVLIDANEFLFDLTTTDELAAKALETIDDFSTENLLQELRTLTSVTKEEVFEAAGDDPAVLVDIHSMYVARLFYNEFQLLHRSLRSASPAGKRVWFSDSGFADNGSHDSVWEKDASRRTIAKVLKSAYQASKGKLEINRILLLDHQHFESIQQRSVSEIAGHFDALAADIVYLMDHHVNVAIGPRELAIEMDKQFDTWQLYNYALVSDGTVMRAGKSHTLWHFDKFDPGHPAFKKLLGNYEFLWQMLARQYEFSAAEWHAHPDYKGAKGESAEQRRHRLSERVKRYLHPCLVDISQLCRVAASEPGLFRLDRIDTPRAASTQDVAIPKKPYMNRGKRKRDSKS